MRRSGDGETGRAIMLSHLDTNIFNHLLALVYSLGMGGGVGICAALRPQNIPSSTGLGYAHTHTNPRVHSEHPELYTRTVVFFDSGSQKSVPELGLGYTKVDTVRYFCVPVSAVDICKIWWTFVYSYISTLVQAETVRRTKLMCKRHAAM